jgi:hypothetical protein
MIEAFAFGELTGEESLLLELFAREVIPRATTAVSAEDGRVGTL